MIPVITIPKKITHGDELVVLSRKEYERIIKSKKEIQHVLNIIANGEKAHREGKTITASSLEEAIKIYGKR